MLLATQTEKQNILHGAKEAIKRMSDRKTVGGGTRRNGGCKKQREGGASLAAAAADNALALLIYGPRVI
jgi:hypothetical protein